MSWSNQTDFRVIGGNEIDVWDAFAASAALLVSEMLTNRQRRTIAAPQPTGVTAAPGSR